MKKTIVEMGIREKAKLITGVGGFKTAECKEIGLEGLVCTDASCGIVMNKNNDMIEYAVCYPSEALIGASWDKQTAWLMGKSVAVDAVKNGKDIILGPGVNIKRTPKCGRNFEYFSEDPVLSGLLAAEYINGAETEGVGCCIKHFAANNQETDRFSINVEIDERTLRELYLMPFQIALNNSSPAAIMCAYNKLNAIWCSENRFLLTDILNEWGYNGITISDWGAVHDSGKALAAGMDLQMPEIADVEDKIEKGINDGIITEGKLNDAVEHILQFSAHLKSLKKNHDNYNRKTQHENAYKMAIEGITLLKNDADILPITKEKYKKIAVIGLWAKETEYIGQGSAHVNVVDKYIDSPFQCIKNNSYGIEVEYIDLFEKSYPITAEFEKLKGVDLVIMFVGSNNGLDLETEGWDRRNIEIPNYIDASISYIFSSFCKNIVIVQQSGSAMLPLPSYEHVKGFVQMWFAGEAGGQALSDILFGIVNPSGKLSETFPVCERTDLEYPGDGTKVSYLEKQKVGYRYYDLHPEQIWYPFGYGISYTSFKYSDLNIMQDGDSYTISCRVTNVGNVDGKEVVQLYIRPVDNIAERSVKELKAFAKVEIRVGKTEIVKMYINKKDLMYYNICLKDWVLENGEYEIMIGSSSQDIMLNRTIKIEDQCCYTK